MKRKLGIIREGAEIFHEEQLDAHLRAAIQKVSDDLVDYFLFKDGVLCEPWPAERGIPLRDALHMLEGARRAARGTWGAEIKGPGIRVYLSAELLSRIHSLKSRLRAALGRATRWKVLGPRA